MELEQKALAEKNWSARWIADRAFAELQPLPMLHRAGHPAAAKQHRPELRHVHMLARKTFALEAAPRSALLDITGDDAYKLYVNGRFVGQGPSPSYHFHYYYNRFDIAAWLKPGRNVIAVHVYYQGLVNRAHNSGDYRQGLLAELHCDGSLTAVTDSSWRVRRSLAYGTPDAEKIAYDTQYAEHIDSRLQERGWRETDYDDSGWETAAVREFADYTLVEQPTPVVQVYRMSPQKLERLPDGRWLIDFGQEITGQLTLRACGESGQQLEIRCGEELLTGGTGRTGEVGVRFKMRCNCTYAERWTLSGQEDELEWFEYKGFRYAEIVGGAEAVRPDSIAAIVRHYPFPEEACRFRSADPLLQSIWDICRNGVKYGSQEHFVDCPTREKGQYLGDNSITAPAHALLTGDLRLYRKALEDFARSTTIFPGMMAVAPGHFMQEFADYSLQFPEQLWKYYTYSGDRDLLRRLAPCAIGIVDYFRRFEREDGLLAPGSDMPQLVDWPPNARDGYDFDFKNRDNPVCHNAINAFYFGCMSSVNRIMKELGQPEPCELERFAESFNRVFWDERQGLYRDAERSGHASLHANALPLCFGLADEARSPTVVEFLKRKKLSCGVYIAYFVLRAFAAAGEHEWVYRLIVTEEKHVQPAADVAGGGELVELTGYWANMVAEGATTCFEAWSKRLKWNTSLCHPWASAPILLMIEEVLGIRPGRPGWAAILFRPRVPAGIADLDLELETASGKIRAWVRNGEAGLRSEAGVPVISEALA